MQHKYTDYGEIDFLYPGGVGETISYKDKKSFDEEVKESNNIGRPIDCKLYNDPNSKTSLQESAECVESLFNNVLKLSRERDLLKATIKTISKMYSIDKKTMIEIVNSASKGLINDKEIEKER